MIQIPSTAGRLVIYKDTGTSVEKLQEYTNIITTGFGINVANILTSNAANPVDAITPYHCQLGTGVVDYLQDGTANNYFFELSSPLTKDQYGRNLRNKVITRPQVTQITESSDPKNSGVTSVTAPFVQIPKSAITIKKESGILVRIVIDKSMANGQAIREIGLFTGDVQDNTKRNLLLSCYKQFTPINKTNEFSLIFDWTIQITDFYSALVWQADTQYISTIGTTRPGGGGSTGVRPSFAYRYAAGNPNTWDLQYPLTGYTITPVQNPANSFVPGSFGFTSQSQAEATASGFSIVPTNGLVSTVGPSPAGNGAGTLVISATPVNPAYPTMTASLPYEISLGKTHPDPGSTYLGQLYWKVPTSATLNTSTVIRCVVPTSAGDFDPAVWGSYTNWTISGVDNAKSTSAFSTSGLVAQIHPVQKNPSGGYETVEVIFPTTVVKAPGQFQYYDLYTTSAALTGTAPTIPASSFITFKVADLSGNEYAIDPDLFTSGNLATSSILKTGPYLTTYKFVYRTKPVPQGTFPNPNNIEHRPFGPTVFMYYTFKKYDPLFTVDIRVANGFYMLPNKGWGGTQADGVGAVMQTPTTAQIRQILGNFYYSRMWIEQEKALYPILNLSGAAETYAGKAWDTGKRGYSESADSQYRRDLVYPFSTANDGEGLSTWQDHLTFDENIQWNCHMLPKQKHFSRRFIFVPQDVDQDLGVGLSVPRAYAFEMANYGDIAFPSRGRSWYNIPKWGPVGDLAPSLGGLRDGVITEFKESWNITRRPNGEKWQLPGPTLKESFAFLYKIKAEDLELVNANVDNWNADYSYGNSVRTPYFQNGGGNMAISADEHIAFQSGWKNAGDYFTAIANLPDYGYDINSNNNHTNLVNAINKTKIPFNTINKLNSDDGGLEFILLYPGASLTNEELRFMGIKTQYACQRFPWIYDVSGNPITYSDVMDAYGFNSSSAPDTNVTDHFYLKYYGAVVNKNNPKELHNLPYSTLAWKTNSKNAEPQENILRVDDLYTTGPYYSNLLSGLPDGKKWLTSKCAYSYKVTTFTTDELVGAREFNGGKNIGGAGRFAGREHISRYYPTYAVLSQLTNDPFIKDEYENLASLCGLTHPPYPTNVTLKGIGVDGQQHTIYHNRFTAKRYLSLVSGTDSSGQGMTFENTRGTVHPVAAMASYYSFAPDTWKTKNIECLDHMASGFHFAWIRSNGAIGCAYIDDNGSPKFGGQKKAWYYGHYLSSTPPTPNLVGWGNYSGAQAQPYADGGTLTDPELGDILNSNGNYFDASNLGDQAFFASYQNYAFSILAKNVLRYRKPELYSSLTSSVSIQASSMVFDVFRFVSGVVGVSDFIRLIRDNNVPAAYGILNSSYYEYSPFFVQYTKNGRMLSGVIQGVDLATASYPDVRTALQRVPDANITNYLSPVDPAKVIGGIPNIVGTVSDYLTAGYSLDDSFKYRGGKKTGIGTVAKVTFSGTDYNTKNILGDEVRYQDCHPFFYGGMMADKNWELSALDASNAFILKSPMMANSYFISYLIDGNLNALAALPDKSYLIDYAKTHYTNLIVNIGGIHYMAPMIAYLRYVRDGDKNGQA